MRRLLAATFAVLVCIAFVFPSDGRADAGGGHDHSAETKAAEAPTAAKAPEIGVTERLGEIVPAGLSLVDEDGKAVDLRELLTIPTIIAPVYYSCPTDCNILLGSLSQTLPQVGLAPGREYKILAVSFDENDTPEIARRKKQEFLTAMGKPFPPQAWRFLTGSETAVRRAMDAIGFGFAREGERFRHPVALIAVSPQGRITRYLYGNRPLSFDIAMAATEAAGDKVGASVKRAIALCYAYDPQSRRYVFDVMRVAGFSVLFAIGLFGLFLAFGGRGGRGNRKPRPRG